MIRRKHQSEGQPAWLLIPQTEHASLAWQLAASWGNRPFPSVTNQELLDAIQHHDDGWHTWDAKPHFDRSGTPIAFDEMQWSDTQPIWIRSIAASRNFGPLAGFVVARHFVTLRQQSENRDESKQFCDTYSVMAGQWRDEWLDGYPDRTAEMAEDAALQIRFFDFLSLWFCCAERHKTTDFPCPNGPRICFRPATAYDLACSPWPWSVQELKLSVSGRLVPANLSVDETRQHWRDSVSVRLQWHLKPA